jgi:hypothetical protein
MREPVYDLRGTPARFVGLVYNQPDAESAIKAAIEEFDVPTNQRDRLIAQRRDIRGPRNLCTRSESPILIGKWP